jgi:membrane-associated phospholipid phosphatase
MAIALSYAYPKGRPLFFTMAAFASFQRIIAGAHYPSDVLFSAALAFTLAVVWAWFTQRTTPSIASTHTNV